jgi:heat shock protein HslJ
MIPFSPRSALPTYQTAMTARLSLLALPLLAACASVEATSPEFPLTSWKLVSIDGQPMVSDKARLEIFEDRIGANVGCNDMGGAMKPDEKNGRLMISGLMLTEMYCKGVMEQERAVSELLSGSPWIFVENGRMALRSENHLAELVRSDD